MIKTMFLLPVNETSASRLAQLVALNLSLFLLISLLSPPAEAKFDFGNLFKKNNNNNNNIDGKQQDQQSGEPPRGPSQGAARPAAGANANAKSPDDSLLDELKQLDKRSEPGSGALSTSSAAARRHKLEKLRAAMAERERLISGGSTGSSPATDDERDHPEQGDHEAEAGEEQVPQRRPAARVGPSGGGGGQGRRRPVVGAEQRARWQRQEMEESERDDYEDGEQGDDHDDSQDQDQELDDEDHKLSKSGRRPGKSGGQEARFVNAAPNSNKKVDKSQLKPIIKARQIVRPRGDRQPLGGAAGALATKSPKSKFFSTKYLKKKVNQAYEKAATVISDIPKYVNQASDSISAFLQLDNKGRILAMLEEVNEDIRFVRKEFSKFSITWTPIVERALNYLGDENLDQVKWKNNDELDFRKDALHSLVFAYEFMRMMIAWRENLLVAHEAYKLYLETFKKDFIDSKQAGGGGGGDGPSIQVDEDFIFQMKTIHSYMLLTAWLSVDEATFEPRMKLDHLMEVEDDRPKNYESEYFRNIIILQELYEPTKAEFDNERNQVVDAISHAGALTQDFEDIDTFFDNFRNALAAKQVEAIDWAVPDELMAPMGKLAPQLQYNQLVYSRAFLRDLKEAKQERASREAEAEE